MYPVQYHKEGLQQYVFFPLEALPEGEYINQLFQYHEVPGFLNYEIKAMNNQYYIYYLLRYKTSIRCMGDYLTFADNLVEEMVHSIISVIQTSKEYLLSLHHIIWSVDYVFIHIETGQLQFCYCPNRLKENDISSFLSELIQIVGKKNETAMIQLLQLYNCVTEPEFHEKPFLPFQDKDLQKKGPEESREKKQEEFGTVKPTEEWDCEECSNRNEIMENKRTKTYGKKMLDCGVALLAVINVSLLLLLFSGVLSNHYFPLMIFFFILLCTGIMVSISGSKGMEGDRIINDYFHNPEESKEQEKDGSSPKQGRTADTSKSVLYGETSVLTVSDRNPDLLVVEEYPKELHLYPCEKDKYPVLKIGDKSVIIGCMRENCDYVLQERGVSRLHAKIMRVESMLYLLDLNSTNGTYLNGEQIESGKDYLLEKGDIVAFSQIEFYVAEKSE